MLDFIDKCVYINLDTRTDRKYGFETQISVLNPDKIQRFSAIADSNGAIGCTKSHIAVLEMAIANSWKNVMILEDDARWNSIWSGIPTFENLAKNQFDVIVLCSVHANFCPETYKLYSCQTTTAYFVNNHYFQKLLDNFKESLVALEKTGSREKFAIDMHWKNLQKIDNWYVVAPSLFIQTPSYSDIENRNVNYTDVFS